MSEAGTRTPRTNFADADNLSERGHPSSAVRHLSGDGVALATATNGTVGAAGATLAGAKRRSNGNGVLTAVNGGGGAAAGGLLARAATVRIPVRQIPTLRDAVFRRLLALADLAAAAGGLAVLDAVSRHGIAHREPRSHPADRHARQARRTLRP